jgi:hypothetical protein
MIYNTIAEVFQAARIIDQAYAYIERSEEVFRFKAMDI